MKNYMLALGYNDNNKVNEVVIGSYPWSGLKKLKLMEISLYKDKLVNLGITDNFDLVGIQGDIGKYTRYNTKNILKRSLVVLARAKAFDEDIYFVTDGIENPSWKTYSIIEKDIQNKGYAIANGKLNKETETIESLVGNYDEVDLRKAQLEYKAYLKQIKQRG